KFVALGMVSSILGVGPAPRVSGPEQVGQVFGLYGAGFAAIFLCVALMYRHAWSCRALLGLDAEQAHEARLLMRHYLIFVAGGCGSAARGLAGRGLRYGLRGFTYMLLGPLCWWHGERSAHPPK